MKLPFLTRRQASDSTTHSQGADPIGAQMLVRRYQTAIDRITLAREEGGVFALVSAVGEEGRTTTAMGLALAAARLKPGRQIALVDFDLRQPSIHARVGLPLAAGVREALAEGADLDAVLRGTVESNLSVLTAGQGAVDLPDVFTSGKFTSLLSALRSRFSMVFVDTAPLLRYGDASLLARHVDGVVMVVRADYSRLATSREALEMLEPLRERIVGAVCNDYRDPFPFNLLRKLG